jgi:hypothetical protein
MIFYNVIKTHKPDKFQARLTESRDYSHNLKVQFKVADFMSNKIQNDLGTFFQDMILKKLNNQFDNLCDVMIKSIENQVIDIEGATGVLMQAAGGPSNASEESIKNILNDIAKAKDKSKHVVFKTLLDKRKTLAAKEKEPETNLQKMATKDFSKELQKTMDAATKYKTYLAGITNPEAKKFFLTFYSGSDKKGYDPQPMFTYFSIYINHVFGFRIPESNENYKEFCSKADSDGSLAVDLGELSAFFNQYVDFAA